MVGRTNVIIAITSIIFLASATQYNVNGSLITEEKGMNTYQIQAYDTVASITDNQSSNKHIMIVLKPQLDDSDPFKSLSINKGNTLNLSLVEVESKFDRSLDDTNIDMNMDVNSNSDSKCRADCVESKPIRDNVPFELPNIPFP